MLKWVRQLDSILRGQATRFSALREGVIDISVRGLSGVLMALGMLYGLCMAVFGLIDSGGLRWQQLISSAVKVPLLFFLTLAVTFPSLYVFNALVGSRLSLLSLLRLLVAALGVILAVLSAFGTIIAFFSISTTSYPFMVLLNVLFFAISGFLGLAFLLRTLHRLTIAQEWAVVPVPPSTPPEAAPVAAEPPAPPADADDTPAAETIEEPKGALDRTEGQVLQRNVKTVFGIWVIVFAFVGAQMAWILRPFIGNPSLPFRWLRPRTSNFFEAVWTTLQQLLSGRG